MDEQGKTQEKFFAQNYADVIVGEEDTNFDSSSVFTKALRCPLVSCHSNEIAKGGCKAEGAAGKSGPCLSPTQLGLIVTCGILLNLGLFIYVAHLQTRIGAIYDLASGAHTHHATVEPQQVSGHRNEVLLSSSKSKVLPQRTKRLIRNPNKCATLGDIYELQDSIRKSTHPSAHLSFPEPPARLVSNLLTKNTTYTWTSSRKSFSLHSFFGPSPATAIAISQPGYYYVYGQVTIERKPGPGSSLLSAPTCYYIVYFNSRNNHLFTITTLPPESLNRQESVYSGGTFYLPENAKLYLEPYGATTYDCAVYTTPDKTFFGAFKL